MKAPSSYPNSMLDSLRLPKGVQTPSFHYRAMRRIFQVTMSAFWKTRVFNRYHEPADGGVVYICNHQSFLDPILMSFALRRPMNFMGRDSLFHIPIFKQMISSVNCFPVKRNTADISALKEAMRRLKNGGQVVIFAEGTRTRDGRIGEFLPGVALLAQRAADWTVPVLIDGAFEAWPRTQLFPGLGNIVVQYAPPIPQAEARKAGSEQFIVDIRRKLIEMQHEVRRRVGRGVLQYD